jgi:HEAT repeat protein/DNA-directed RNA polymerase subunit M/transcription elongation factor TFIIS
MIRYSCPKCQTILETPEEHGGSCRACPKCGQTMRVPLPPINKTVLAPRLPDPVALTPPPNPQPQTTTRVVCPGCGRSFTVPVNLVRKRAKCSKCGWKGYLSGGRTSRPPGRGSTPARQTESAYPSPAPRPKGLNLFATLSLLAGIGALPAGIFYSRPPLSVVLASVGIVLGLFGLIYSVALRRAGSGLAKVSVIVCGSVLLAAYLIVVQAQNQKTAGQDQLADKGDGDRSQGGNGDRGSKGSKPKNKKGEEEEEVRPEKKEGDEEKKGGDKEKKKRDDTEKDESKGKKKKDETEKDEPTELPTDKVVARLMKDLKSGKTTDRVRAAKELAKLGKAAEPAARAVCEALLDKNETVQQAAIEALESIQPKLVKPLLTLLKDKGGSNHFQATWEIGNMGSEAKVAIPVLIWHLKYGLKKLNPGDNVNICANGIRTLGKIGQGDPQAVKVLIEIASSTTTTEDFGVGIEDCRNVALGVLASFSESRGQLRKQIITCLDTVLRKLQSTTSETLDRDYWGLQAAIYSVGRFGPDAKKTIPTLKKLRTHSNKEIREAAIEALKNIQKKE